MSQLPSATVYGLTPDQFKDLTVKEYMAVSDGWAIKHKHQWEPLALIASFLSAGFKKKYTVQEILESTGYEHLKKNYGTHKDVKAERDFMKDLAKKQVGYVDPKGKPK